MGVSNQLKANHSAAQKSRKRRGLVNKKYDPSIFTYQVQILKSSCTTLWCPEHKVIRFSRVSLPPRETGTIWWKCTNRSSSHFENPILSPRHFPRSRLLSWWMSEAANGFRSKRAESFSVFLRFARPLSFITFFLSTLSAFFTGSYLFKNDWTELLIVSSQLAGVFFSDSWHLVLA